MRQLFAYIRKQKAMNQILSAAERLDALVAKMRSAGISDTNIAILLRSAVDRLTESQK